MGDSNKLLLEGMRSLVDLGGEGACLVDSDGWRVVYANLQLEQLIGLPHESPVGMSIFVLVPELETASSQQQLAEMAAGERIEARIDCRAAANCTTSAIAEVRVRRVEADKVVLLAMVLRTSTEAGAAAGATRRESVDPLTGLANRGFILEKLNQIIHGERLEDQRCAVLFIDVDNFKQVNDAYGHLVGDDVLCEVAKRLEACVRSDDHVARFGGDEFLILLERVGGRGEIETVVRRIQAAFARPISLPQGEVTLSVSVGVAQPGVDGTSADELIGAADRAMYAAKRATA